MPPWVRIVVLKWLAKFVRIKVPRRIQDIKKKFKAEGQEVNEELRREHETLSKIQEESEVMSTGGIKPMKPDRKVSFIPGEMPVYQQLDVADIHRLLAQERRPSIWSNQSAERPVKTRPCSIITDVDALLGNDKSSFLPMMICRQENIANNVRRLVKMARAKEEEDIKSEEWKVVAEVIDKFLLWVFIAALVTSLLLIFAQSPRQSK